MELTGAAFRSAHFSEGYAEHTCLEANITRSQSIISLYSGDLSQECAQIAEKSHQAIPTKTCLPEGHHSAVLGHLLQLQRTTTIFLINVLKMLMKLLMVFTNVKSVSEKLC